MNKDLLEKKKRELVDLYMQKSKHSQYQSLPPDFKGILDESQLNIASRYEKERWKYVVENVNIKDQRILDIGGNSGFFSFESLRQGAKVVDYYEGNQAHAEFVEMASEILGWKEQISVYNSYYEFNVKNDLYDVVFLLNVLHHLGDDYGDSKFTIEQAKKIMMRELNSMAKVTDILVFQLGFNWKGNPKMCLFDKGTKGEMIEFIKESISDYWDVLSIGIPEKRDGNIVYVNLNDSNIKRDDTLGEFLNRPLFILKSRRKI